MELGKRLKEIRLKNDMTQEELAEKFCVTRQTISNWENGKSYPDLETLVCISDEFHVSLDTMLKGDREMVRKITKQQINGKKQKFKLIIAALAAAAVIIAIVFALNNTVTKLSPDDYDITVKEVTLEDVSIDEINEIATYKDPEGGESVKADETGADGGNYEAFGQGAYVFKEENYDNLMKYGKAYEIVLTSDKRIDGYFLSNSTENGTLEIDVWRSNSNIFKPGKKSRFMAMWIDESGKFNEIHDFDTNEVVWK